MTDHNAGLTTWVIYDHPADHPEHIVLRPWTVLGADRVLPGPVTLCDSLDRARELLAPLGLHRLDRHPDDDPTITEVWL